MLKRNAEADYKVTDDDMNQVAENSDHENISATQSKGKEDNHTNSEQLLAQKPSSSDPTHSANLPATHKMKKDIIYTSRHHEKLTSRQIFSLVRRLLTFIAALIYVQTSITACIDAFGLLNGHTDAISEASTTYNSRLIAAYAGNTTIRQSPLVMNVLNGDTSPRNGTLYLEEASTSFTTCSGIELPERIYDDEFQRDIYAYLVQHTAYNITLLSTVELIAPIVDCTFTSIVVGDLTAIRFFYLVRMQNDNDDVYFLTMSMSVQDYYIPSQGAHGSAGVSAVIFINDLQASKVDRYFVLALGYPYELPSFQVYTLLNTTDDHMWQLQSIPTDPSTENPKVVLTACRIGFYISVEEEQSNSSNQLWTLLKAPLEVLSTWQWLGQPKLRDSWAWVHWVHAWFALDLVFHLLLLALIVYRKFQNNDLWIGDAFVSVSRILWVRSAIVLTTWRVDGYWALMEFCLADASTISQIQNIHMQQSIMRADLMAIYLSIAGLLGQLLRDRVDPALAMALFFFGYELRTAIRSMFPALVKIMTDASLADYTLSMTAFDEEVYVISPLRVWSIHELESINWTLIAATLFPLMFTFLFVILYAMIRKTYRICYPEKLVVQKLTGFSEDEAKLQEQRMCLTRFELATGAALQTRYGLVADYDNALFIKGTKFASADGVFSNGFVVANKKFLLPAKEILTIWLMKLTRMRFKNVYMFEIENGNTVKQTARLVYPELISYYDLAHTDIDALT